MSKAVYLIFVKKELKHTHIMGQDKKLGNNIRMWAVGVKEEKVDELAPEVRLRRRTEIALMFPDKALLR